MGNPYIGQGVGSVPYLNDPSKYQGFDSTGLSQGAIAQGNQAGGNQIAQAKAQAAGMGGGRSSAVQNNVNGIQSGLGQNSQNIFNTNAANSFQQQLAQLGQNNQYNLGEQVAQNQLLGEQINGQNGANNGAQGWAQAGDAALNFVAKLFGAPSDNGKANSKSVE